MKKIISLLVVAAMLVTGLMIAVPGTATDLPESDLYTHITGEISSDKTTLTVTAELGNNPGLWCYKSRLGYNANALKLVSVTNGDVWSNDEYIPANIKNNPVTYYAQFAAALSNNTKNGVLAVYNFEIVDANANFNVKLDINPREVFGVAEDGSSGVFYTMQIINDCPQELPFDTTALDALATDIEELPAYDGMNDEQIAKMQALYNSVHGLTGKSETYFKETYANMITKIDELYAAHQWALVEKELDALGARVEALPTYSQMTEAEIAEMLTLRTEIAALEETHKAYVQEKYADALARMNASYDEYVRINGLNAIGARVDALPAYAAMTEAQVQEMLALIGEIAALSADDAAYVKATFAEGYGRLEASKAAYDRAQELNAIGARIEALPAYAEMTDAQVQEMLTLVAAVEAMSADDAAYITANYKAACDRMNASYARYTRIQELEAIAARINALPDEFSAMTEAQITEMLALVDIIDAIENADDQQYMIDNHEDAITKLMILNVAYETEEAIKEIAARIEALPNADVITEEYLGEVTDLCGIVAIGGLAVRFQEEIPEAYENLVNAFLKLTYGGTDAVDMDKVAAFVDAVNALTDGQDQEVFDLLYALVAMEEEDAATAIYITLMQPKALATLVEKYFDILMNADVDMEAMEALAEKILALPEYDKMTDAQKAELAEIIATIDAFTPVEMSVFKIGAADAYASYVLLSEAYKNDPANNKPDPQPEEPGKDTTAPAEGTTAPAQGDKKPVQTGDNMTYIVIAAAVATAACAAVVVVRKKKETV